MKKIIIEGMTCSHCEKAVKEALENLNGVNSVDVNLKTKEVKVEGENLDNNKIKEAIDAIGFDVTSID